MWTLIIGLSLGFRRVRQRAHSTLNLRAQRSERMVGALLAHGLHVRAMAPIALVADKGAGVQRTVGVTL